MVFKTYGELFAGIGGASQGLINAGYIPSWAIEWNLGAIDILKANHDIPTVIHDDVCAIDYSNLPTVDLLWASPVCTAYSNANHNRGESPDDIKTAYAVIAAAKRANAVIIENVPAYKKGRAYQAIADNLRMQGFIYSQQFILNAADFGNPSNRTRLYSVFSKSPVLSIVHKPEDVSAFTNSVIIPKSRSNWFVTILGAAGNWERSNLTPKQLEAIGEYPRYPHEPFAIERCGYYSSPKIIPASSTFPCLRSHGSHDGKNPKPGYGKIGSYRRQYDFVHEESSYSLTPQLMGMLMGFPIDYGWGNNRAQAVGGIGNSVSPIMSQIMAGLV